MEDQELKKAFKHRVQLRLAAIGKTQADLALEWKTTRQNISALINSGPYVNYSSLEKLAQMLDTSVCWLLEGDLVDAIDRIDNHIDIF